VNWEGVGLARKRVAGNATIQVDWGMRWDMFMRQCRVIAAITMSCLTETHHGGDFYAARAPTKWPLPGMKIDNQIFLTRADELTNGPGTIALRA